MLPRIIDLALSSVQTCKQISFMLRPRKVSSISPEPRIFVLAAAHSARTYVQLYQVYTQHAPVYIASARNLGAGNLKRRRVPKPTALWIDLVQHVDYVISCPTCCSLCSKKPMSTPSQSCIGRSNRPTRTLGLPLPQMSLRLTRPTRASVIYVVEQMQFAKATLGWPLAGQRQPAKQCAPRYEAEMPSTGRQPHLQKHPVCTAISGLNACAHSLIIDAMLTLVALFHRGNRTEAA